MKFWLIRFVNIGLLIAFFVTLTATPFMNIHFFKETHEFFGTLTFVFALAHIFIYRKGLKAMFRRQNSKR